MDTPSVAGRSMSMSLSSSTIPRELPTVVTYRYQSQKKVVTLAASHEAAQVIAARSFPTLANVDPSWLQFSIAVRYRTTGERKEYSIQPDSWYYVTSKLVAYRCIDVHVVPPSRNRSPALGTPSSFASSLPETPPRQHDAPSFFVQHGPSAVRPLYYPQLPRVDDDGDPNDPYPGSPVTPPPKYPGSSSGFGYGFSWGPSPSLRPSPMYSPAGRSSPYSTYGEGMEDAMDRRGPQHRPSPGGWGMNSVGFPASARASPARTHSQLSRAMSLSVGRPTAPPSPSYSHVPLPPNDSLLPQQPGATGPRLFSSIRRALPGGGSSRSWSSESAAVVPSASSSSRWGAGRRLRRNSQPVKPPEYLSDYEEEDYSEVATRSGRSYVPSLI